MKQGDLVKIKKASEQDIARGFHVGQICEVLSAPDKVGVVLIATKEKYGVLAERYVLAENLELIVSSPSFKNGDKVQVVRVDEINKGYDLEVGAIGIVKSLTWDFMAQKVWVDVFFGTEDLYSIVRLSSSQLTKVADGDPFVVYLIKENEKLHKLQEESNKYKSHLFELYNKYDLFHVDFDFDKD